MKVIYRTLAVAALVGGVFVPVTARHARADYPPEVTSVLGFTPTWGTADNPERPGGGTTPSPEPPPPEPPR